MSSRRWSGGREDTPGLWAGASTLGLAVDPDDGTDAESVRGGVGLP